MADDFISWDHLDLDDILGEDNWTDTEATNLLGSENEWITSSDEGEEVTPQASAKEKENKKPTTTTNTTRRKHFKCPLCEKDYTSTSGFRGHVMKKHDRPDLKAHMHRRTTEEPEADVQLPTDTLPLSTEADFERELPSIIQAALGEIRGDRFLASPHSTAGAHIINIATVMQTQISLVCAFLLIHIKHVFVTNNLGAERILQQLHQLRLNASFVGGFSDIIKGSATSEVPQRFANLFIQHFLTNVTSAFFERQSQLIDSAIKHDAEEITENDHQVIFYICGYLVHALKKRYYRIKNKCKRDKLLSILDNLQGSDSESENAQVSRWMELMNRGGLKKPTYKFYQIMVQVERWLRECVHKDNLHPHSLVILQMKFMEYKLLQAAWNKLMQNSDTDRLILEHVLSLFLKVRGFALVKLVRKEMCKKRKQMKAKAGTKKALRKELKEMNTN